MNITYLLGAGASYNALPVIDELPSRLEVFQIVVKDQLRILKRISDSINQQERELIKKVETLEKDIEWLREEVRRHKTVDTLAKKFYVVLEHHESLIKLKKVMIAYFLFEQTRNDSNEASYIRQNPRSLRKEGQLKESPDKRYDSFIATIISTTRGKLNLDNDFNVITWNYDVQFELAYENYLPNPTFFEISKRLQTIPSKLFLGGSQRHDPSQFSVVRLNGVAGLSNLSTIKSLGTNLNGEVFIEQLIPLLAELHSQDSNEDVPAFSFAWEDFRELPSVHPKKSEVFNVARQILELTDILVVIGYSFPSFNRSTDKILLSNLMNLKKVFVQDAKSEEVVDLIKSSFQLYLYEELDDVFGSTRFFPTKNLVPVIPVKGVDQFFIPPEADI